MIYDIPAVLEATDLLALAGEYTDLKRSGSQYRGLCPFHQERTPSFTVSQAKRRWFCFGCGTGGDAIQFMVRTGKGTKEAIRFLAARAGVKGKSTRHRSPNEKLELAQLRREAEWFFGGVCNKLKEEIRIGQQYLRATPLDQWDRDVRAVDETFIAARYAAIDTIRAAPIAAKMEVYSRQTEKTKQDTRRTLGTAESETASLLEACFADLLKAHPSQEAMLRHRLTNRELFDSLLKASCG